MRRLRLGIRTGRPWGQILSQPQVLLVSGLQGGIPWVRPRQRAPTGALGVVGAAGTPAALSRTPGLGWPQFAQLSSEVTAAAPFSSDDEQMSSQAFRHAGLSCIRTPTEGLRKGECDSSSDSVADTGGARSGLCHPSALSAHHLTDPPRGRGSPQHGLRGV